MLSLRQKIEIISFDSIIKNVITFSEEINYADFKNIRSKYLSTNELNNMYVEVVEEIEKYVSKYNLEGVCFYNELVESYNIDNNKFCPNFLFYRGDLGLLTKGVRIAMVGTRKISEYGKAATKKLFTYLENVDCIIVSGLALGSDTVAFNNALQNNKKCIAVLPTPFSKISPVKNSKMLETIVGKGGLVVTEYYSKDKIFKSNFVKRNQIIDTFSHSTIAIEFGEASGTMHQINNAVQNNKVLAVIKPNYSLSPKEFIHGYELVMQNPNILSLDSKESIYTFLEKSQKCSEKKVTEIMSQLWIEI